MRDGNMEQMQTLRRKLNGFSLPMRDGNPWPCLLLPAACVGFSLPMRDGNPRKEVKSMSYTAVLAYL